MERGAPKQKNKEEGERDEEEEEEKGRKNECENILSRSSSSNKVFDLSLGKPRPQCVSFHEIPVT